MGRKLIFWDGRVIDLVGCLCVTRLFNSHFNRQLLLRNNLLCFFDVDFFFDNRSLFNEDFFFDCGLFREDIDFFLFLVTFFNNR